MIRKILIAVLPLLVATNCTLAQKTERSLTGYIGIDGDRWKQEGNSIPFVKITFISTSDTSKKAVALSDLHGNYITRGPIINGDCRVYYEVHGWRPTEAKDTPFVDDNIHGKLKVWNVGLKPQNSSPPKQYKAQNISINNSYRKDCSSTTELLTLYEQLSIVGNKLSDSRGEVYVFINGRCSTLQKAQKIKPQKVLELEYYDISEPKSHAGNPYTGALNVITKRY